MKRFMGLVMVGLMLLGEPVVIGQAVAEDDRGREAYTTFENKLRSLPQDHDLKGTSFSCMSLPVRDKSPGQVGEGHPGERDAKLQGMFEFLMAMDQLILDTVPHVSVNVAVEGVPISGVDPGAVKDPTIMARYIEAIEANHAAIEEHNFQMQLKETRRKYARFVIPHFIKYEYPTAQKNEHLRTIIREGLKSDAKANDDTVAFLQATDAR